MANNRVVHFEIQADDIERAKKFYENTFGWQVPQMMKESEGGMMDYWGLVTGPDGTPGINGGLYKRGSDKLYTYDCTIMVDDVDKAMEDVKKNGGKIRVEKAEIPGVGFFAGCEDTEGNRFGLMQATEWKP
ncbi:VOC family protein [Polluticoccus soli]|uniref:VOC family protein n=1 Tax=Polluticoccus soli TaxID=3034150 RepID=UPI0023E18AF4|nr:VOC family protein [Flavipsychrobacter sp. JY13-12]